MNHLTAWAITITAFSSGLYGIYRVIRAKYVSYDTNPIHYWSNRKQRVKKRYKSFKANRRNKNTKTSKLNNRNKSQLSYAKYGKLNRWSISK